MEEEEVGSSLTKETLFLFLFQSDTRIAALPLSRSLFFSWTLPGTGWRSLAVFWLLFIYEHGLELSGYWT